MALTSWTPYGNGNDEMLMRRGDTPQSFRRLQGEMNRLFENFFGGTGIQPQGQSWSGLAIPSESNVSNVRSRQPNNLAGRTAINTPSATTPNVASHSQTPTTMPSGTPGTVSSQPAAVGSWQFQFNPCVEVTEDAETIHVMAELPGIDQDDLELFCNDHSLTITGEKRHQTMDGDNGNFLQTERSYGYFRRSIPFNVDVDTDNAEASYEDGVLHVRLPKAGASKGTRLNIE